MDNVGLNPTGRPTRSSAGTRRRKKKRALWEIRVTEDLRLRYAKALADKAGSKAFKEKGTEWDHFRSVWLGYADAILSVNEEIYREQKRNLGSASE